MNFCTSCGGAIVLRVPSGDNRERHACRNCGEIHYQNPKIVVGCLVESDDKILLCRRAIEPRYGLWTLPAGFMENGETTAQGAIRETLEEANASVSVEMLYSLINIPHINQVYLIFHARLADPVFSAGSESLDVALFSREEIPWNGIAFPAVTKTLEWYFADKSRGFLTTHTGDIIRPLKSQ